MDVGLRVRRILARLGRDFARLQYNRLLIEKIIAYTAAKCQLDYIDILLIITLQLNVKKNRDKNAPKYYGRTSNRLLNLSISILLQQAIDTVFIVLLCQRKFMKGIVLGSPLWEATTKDVAWVNGNGADGQGFGRHRELGCCEVYRREDSRNASTYSR